MYAIRLPTGEFLDVSKNFEPTTELSNQVFSTSRSDILPGSFTFPADLPLSDRNRALLSNPQALSNAYKFSRIADVELYCHGRPLFKGELRITGATATRARISIVSNPVSGLKDRLLSEYDLGGERGLGGFDENMALFAATAETPETYDFAVFPVYAPLFDQQTADIVDNDYINWWNDTDYTFSFDSVALIPFPRIDYLLQQIFAQSVPDFRFINAFQVSHELKRLYLLNNYDARISIDNVLQIAYQIDLRNHVGDMKAADLLKALMGRFCLGLFTSPFDHRIILRPLRDLVVAPSRHDWTDYMLADYDILDDEPDTPQKFCDPPIADQTDKEKKFTDFVTDEVDLPEFSNMQTFQSALAGLDVGLYYILALEQIWGVTDAYGPNTAYFVGRKRRCVVFDDTPVFEPELAPAMTFEFAGWGHFPWYEQTGSYWQNDGTDPDPEFKRYENTCDPQIVFYRGFQDNVGAVTHERPYASNDVWRPDAAPLPIRVQITDKASGPTGAYTNLGEAQHSLLWSGPYGLYENWWKGWHQMLLHGKHVTMRFTLPIGMVTDFNFEHKVRVQTIDYFVKKLRIGKALSGSRVLVEAALVSCI